VIVKPGERLRSTTSETEVVVVKAPADTDLDVRCGGQPMVPVAEAAGTTGEPAAPFDEPTLVGKRYIAEELGVELLCNKGGAGSLSVGDEPLALAGAKPLPASD
jgi:hypothetical protein